MHPYDNHKSNLLGIASALWYHGYSVFMFDFRSFTPDPKTRQTIGYLEQFDAVAAVNYVINNYSLHRDSDPKNNKRIILMGSPINVVSKETFDIPLLLLHSECDAAVPCAHSKRLYTACNSEIKNLYCIKSSDHCGGYFKDPKLFTKYLCQWVDDVLDLELRERKKKNTGNGMGSNTESEEQGNVVTNNAFIMFDTKDDIGIDDDIKAKDENEASALSEASVTVLQGVQGVDSNAKLKSQAVRDVKSSPPSSSVFGYLGSFFRKSE